MENEYSNAVEVEDMIILEGLITNVSLLVAKFEVSNLANEIHLMFVFSRGTADKLTTKGAVLLGRLLIENGINSDTKIEDGEANIVFVCEGNEIVLLPFVMTTFIFSKISSSSIK